MIRFSDRREAGEKLADFLNNYRKNKKTVVYALPRGGVVVAEQIVKKIKAPLDLVITKKISHPFNPEYAICAIDENGQLTCGPEGSAFLDNSWFDREKEKALTEIKRRRKIYCQNRQSIPAQGKFAIIVDDGAATGLTIKSAVNFIKNQKPRKIIIALPVVPDDVVKSLSKITDEFIYLEGGKNYLGAVGAYYYQFEQVTDQQVVDILRKNL